MELIIISDLHLSAGLDNKTRKYSRNEDFFFDEQFKRFLEYLQEQHSGNKEHYHLIIAGDMFDFLQVDPNGLMLNDYLKETIRKKPSNKITSRERKFGLGTEADKTVWKLGVIAKGHEVFFEALANFLARGNRLSIITGNHDIELYWRDVQNELVKQIVLKHPSKAQQIGDQIRFYPWFYYDKEHRTYVEHGNQYDPLNSFQYLLYPLLTPDSDKLRLPFGSFFVRYFFNKLETSNPFADNIKPPTKYLLWALKKDTLKFFKNIVSYFFTMLRLFLKGGNLSKLQRISLEENNNDRLRDSAQDLGVPVDSVKKIYSLMAPPFSRTKLRVLLHFAGTIFLVVTPVTAIVLYRLASIWEEFPRWLAPSSLAFLIVPISKWIYSRFAEDIFKKILQIRRHLKDHGIDVQTVVFGHTHDPDIRPDARDIGITDKDFRYFNTGTWTTVFSEEERIIREEKQFAFVWITEKDGKLEPTLYRWNDCLKQPEKLILFDRPGD